MAFNAIHAHQTEQHFADFNKQEVKRGVECVEEGQVADKQK